MRITTQMLNASARRAGLPINNTSLLNYINSDGTSQTNNALLEALNKNKKTTANSIDKNTYEKLDKEADKLTQSANGLLQEGENSLFEQAKKTEDNQKIYDGIEELIENYNSTMDSLKGTSNVMTQFYKEILAETPEEMKEKLESVGVTFGKDGTASVDMEKLKAADIDTLEELFGSKSDFVNKVKILSAKISDHAEANLDSISSTYTSKGSTYNSNTNSKYDLWG